MNGIFHMESPVWFDAIKFGCNFTHNKSSVLFVEHRQTVQNAASDLVLHCLLTEVSFKI